MRLLTLSVLAHPSRAEEAFRQTIDLDDPHDEIARCLRAREDLVELTRTLVLLQEPADPDGVETLAWSAAARIASARMHLEAIERRFRLEHATAVGMRKAGAPAWVGR